MKRLLVLVALCAVSPVVPAVPTDTPPSAAETAAATWTTDYAAALVKARAEGKAVLLNFTGSDWCVWCHRLRDQVFTQKAFADYAQENLVLVELDFPRKKTQPPAEKRQNDELVQRFDVSGYPTVVLVDAEGRELGRTGYIQGGPKTFVRELKRFAAKALAEKS